jgi:hypothetical protein
MKAIYVLAKLIGGERETFLEHSRNTNAYWKQQMVATNNAFCIYDTKDKTNGSCIIKIYFANCLSWRQDEL